MPTAFGGVTSASIVFQAETLCTCVENNSGARALVSAGSGVFPARVVRHFFCLDALGLARDKRRTFAVRREDGGASF